jgi:hypothetical protein
MMEVSDRLTHDHHPLAMRELAQFMGYRLDGADEDTLALGRMIPMFIFKPISEIISMNGLFASIFASKRNYGNPPAQDVRRILMI